MHRGRSQGRFCAPVASACEAQVGICLGAAPLALPPPGTGGPAGVRVPLLGRGLCVFASLTGCVSPEQELPHLGGAGSFGAGSQDDVAASHYGNSHIRG